MEVGTKEAAIKAAKKGAELSAMLACTVARRDQRVLAIQKQFGGTISHLSAEIEAIEAAVADWARGNRADFAGKQSLELPCAVLAFHAGGRSCEPLPKWNWADVVKAARRLVSWRKYIRIKFEINRQRILEDTKGDRPKLNPDRLEKIGLEIVNAPETFTVEFQLKTKLKKDA